MEKGTIIFLNGVSSSGKSTLARELVKQLPNYFHLGIDEFDYFIERVEDRPNKRLIPVETEVFFHHTIAMFSNQGVHLVVDHILHNRFISNHCCEVLAAHPVLLVEVHCPVEELERRERLRGDRHIGQSRRQLSYVHQNEFYDVKVDTFLESRAACAGKIINFLKTGNYPNGWIKTCQRVASNDNLSEDHPNGNRQTS